mmetsp:Transcript_913/g.2441  ORF Transcript_913/g.2441 Transcript_913/m.2441 type:complete len:200 (+) Transcript_913:327-926(+)
MKPTGEPFFTWSPNSMTLPLPTRLPAAYLPRRKMPTLLETTRTMLSSTDWSGADGGVTAAGDSSTIAWAGAAASAAGAATSTASPGAALTLRFTFSSNVPICSSMSTNSVSSTTVRRKSVTCLELKVGSYRSRLDSASSFFAFTSAGACFGGASASAVLARTKTTGVREVRAGAARAPPALAVGLWNRHSMVTTRFWNR